MGTGPLRTVLLQHETGPVQGWGLFSRSNRRTMKSPDLVRASPGRLPQSAHLKGQSFVPGVADVSLPNAEPATPSPGGCQPRWPAGHRGFLLTDVRHGLDATVPIGWCLHALRGKMRCEHPRSSWTRVMPVLQPPPSRGRRPSSMVGGTRPSTSAGKVPVRSTARRAA